jgi:hypothetical protein
MSHPSELEWIEFYMPDGFKARYALDGVNVRMMVDENDIPDGVDIGTRMMACYDYFFTHIFKDGGKKNG